MIGYRVRHWASALLAVGAVAGAAVACGTRGDPDPGGKILAALMTVEQAVPHDARITLHQEYEPRWDSCDGRADTAGWSNPIVIVQFTTDESADTLVADTNTTLLTQGWQLTTRSSTDFGPSVGWTRTAAGSTVANATLQPFTGSAGRAITWELVATAPPNGRQASGC
ncbi:MAG: hypothetical protein BGO26_13360 [Actinobacteria bacterium 69-20]|nr:hypothetical protein [Actinomycetota bacterium]OJV23647.1 MAG: hypothetical protein BGO26_13360 [Actinobacteria bacterium 69-20]